MVGSYRCAKCPGYISETIMGKEVDTWLRIIVGGVGVQCHGMTLI